MAPEVAGRRGYPASLNPEAAARPAVMISATITPITPTPHIGQSIGPSASLPWAWSSWP